MDAVIVGGGLIGLSLAWRLRQSGLRVAVWESGQVGREASWAGAGMLAPGGEMDRQTWWGELALESLKLYPEFVRELHEASDVLIDYRRCGALEFAADDRSFQELQQRAARQRSWGIAVQEAGARTLFYPDDAVVDPRDLLHALRLVCERAGVVIREGREVRRIVAERNRVLEPEPAEIVVLAAGAWSSSVSVLVDGSLLSIETAIPMRGHLISFAAAGQTQGPIWRNQHTYILERHNGVVIAGSTTEEVGFSREPDPALFQDVEQRARKLMPQLKGTERTAGWIGFRPGTRSGEPQLKQLGKTPVYLAYGHYRNGILMAPRTAALLTEMITASLQTGSSLHRAHL